MPDSSQETRLHCDYKTIPNRIPDTRRERNGIVGNPLEAGAFVAGDGAAGTGLGGVESRGGRTAAGGDLAVAAHDLAPAARSRRTRGPIRQHTARQASS